MSARTPEAEPLLTPAEVATMFRVDPKTVTRWAKAGKLTSIRTLVATAGTGRPRSVPCSRGSRSHVRNEESPYAIGQGGPGLVAGGVRSPGRSRKYGARSGTTDHGPAAIRPRPWGNERQSTRCSASWS